MQVQRLLHHLLVIARLRLRQATVGIEVQAAVQVEAQDRKQRLISLAVGCVAHGHPQIDPHAVRNPVAVVVDVPGVLTVGRGPSQVGLKVRIRLAGRRVDENVNVGLLPVKFGWSIQLGRNITCRKILTLLVPPGVGDQVGAVQRGDRHDDRRRWWG